MTGDPQRSERGSAQWIKRNRLSEGQASGLQTQDRKTWCQSSVGTYYPFQPGPSEQELDNIFLLHTEHCWHSSDHRAPRSREAHADPPRTQTQVAGPLWGVRAFPSPHSLLLGCGASTHTARGTPKSLPQPPALPAVTSGVPSRSPPSRFFWPDTQAAMVFLCSPGPSPPPRDPTHRTPPCPVTHPPKRVCLVFLTP